MRSRWLQPRAAVGRHQGVRSTSHFQGTYLGSPSRRVRPVCPTVATRPRKCRRGLSFLAVLQDFKKWRDPDSNRGHHDFQLGKAHPLWFTGVRKSAQQISRICNMASRACLPLFAWVVVKLSSAAYANIARNWVPEGSVFELGDGHAEGGGNARSHRLVQLTINNVL
jgi:hypothetical protein